MNPELRRNLWIELTRQRLVLTPTVIVLLLALVSASTSRPWPVIFSTSVTIFVLLVHFWGTRKASEAVTDEVRERTWDWQRLSSLGPAQMGWGKLAGATAFTWYGGAICLVFMAAATAIDPEPGAGFIAAGLVGSALALHGVALAGSLQASRKDSRVGSRIGTLLLIPVAIGIAAVYMGSTGRPTRATWYGVEMPAMAFLALSAWMFAAWAVLAVHREMARELKVRMLPWAWPAFGVFAGAYAAGFPELGRPAWTTLFVFGAAIAMMLLVYYGIFADVTSAITLRRLGLRIRARQWRRALEELPLWATALAGGAVFAVAASLRPNPFPFAAPGGGSWLGLFPIAMLLFAARDCGILVFFALSPRNRRPEGLTLLWVALLSWVLPGLLGGMGLAAAATALMPFGLPAWQAAAVALAQALAAWGLAAWRWRRLEAALGASRAVAGRGV